MPDRAASRRQFLKFMSASPLFMSGSVAALAGESPSKLPDPMMWAPQNLEELIKSPKEAINVFDLEPVCRKNVPPSHFGYMSSGLDDEVTLRANREGFLKFHCGRAVSSTSARSTCERTFSASPTTRRSWWRRWAASARSTTRANWRPPAAPRPATTCRFSRPRPAPASNDAARGAPIWYQLYATNKWEVAQAMVKRAENADASRSPSRSTQRRPQPGNPVPPAAERHARLQRVPRPQQSAANLRTRDVPGARLTGLRTPSRRP